MRYVFFLFVLSICCVGLASEDSLRSMDGSERHSYPGGRDDQDLTVQTSLPLPTRTPESAAGVEEIILPADTNSNEEH